MDFEKQFEFAESLESSLSNMLENEEEIVKQLGLQESIQKKIYKLQEKMDNKHYPSMLSTVQKYEKSLQAQIKNQKTINATVDKRKDELLDIIDSNKDILNQMGLQHYISDELTKLDQIKANKLNPKLLAQSETLVEDLRKSIAHQEEINEKVKELEGNSIFKQASDKIKSTMLDVRATLSDPKIASGIFLANASARAGSFAKSIEETRQNLGMSGGASFEMAGNIASAGASGLLLGYGMSDAADATKAIVEETKSLNLATKKNIKAVARLSSWYGVSASESAKLLKVFTEINSNSNQMGLSTLKTVENLSKAKGAMPGKVMSDLAGNAVLLSGRTKETADNLIKGAISANKLGVELSDLTSISSGLLNVESSIADEMELSVLSKKRMNFQAARLAAHSEDEEGMVKALLKEVGSYEEFQNMNLEARQKMQEMFGQNIGTMLANQEELNNQTSVQEGWLKKSYLHVVGMAKGMWKYKDLMTSSATMLFSMKTAFPNIGKSIKKATGFLGDFIKKLLKKKAIEKTTKALPGDDGQLSLFDKPKKTKISKKQTNLINQQKKLQKTKIPKNKKTPGGQKGNPIVDWINSWKKMDWKALLKFAAAVGILIVTIPLLALGLKQFNTVKWESALMGMGSMLALALIMKLVGKQTKGMLKGAFAMLIVSTAMIPLAFALNMFNGINWPGAILGMTSLLIMTYLAGQMGAQLSMIVQGALAMMLIGVAMVPFTFALSLLQGLDWKTIAAAGIVLIGFTIAVLALGAIMSGPGAAIFAAGVLGFIMLGGALIVLSFGIMAISKASSKLIEITKGLIDLAGPMFQVGKGFMSMGIGLGLFAGGLLAMAPLIPIFMIVSFGVSAMAVSVSMMMNSMSRLVPLLLQLTSMAPSLSQVGLGFASMGAGLGIMAGGLMAITPFLPALAALTAIGNISKGNNKSKKKDKSENQVLIEKLDTLIDILIKGGTVKLDGREMGKWMGMKIDTMKTHPQ